MNLPNSPALPLPFAIGDYPEVQEPVAAPLQLPITVNGRLSQPAEVDKYELAVNPGEEFMFALQARELGTSKLMGLITIYDEKGKRLASAGDGPLPRRRRRRAGEQPDAGRSRSSVQSSEGRAPV